MNLDKHFLAIWQRALDLPDLHSLNKGLVASWATEQQLPIAAIEEREIGDFNPIPCVVLRVSGGEACFPRISAQGNPLWGKRRISAEHQASLWEKMEWFSPLWIPTGTTQLLLKEVELCNRERALELFDHHTSTIYTLAFQAVCIAQLLQKSACLRHFVPLAREAYLAFYSGYRASSIAALIPAIEGGLTKIVQSYGDRLNTSGKIDIAIDRSIAKAAKFHFGDAWVPPEYATVDFLFALNERVYFFETFRRWLKRSFFRRTGEYDGLTWLNRHLFAHAMDSSWQQSGNFRRIVVALTTLGVVESWCSELDGVSFFFPDMNDDSTLLWEQGQFQAQAQIHLKLIEQKRYEDHGRLVPEMPTDNGVMLRKAVLSEDCINDLVRPLRNAGWMVAVGEPDEEALWVVVVASGGNKKISVALLYSCATDNMIYRNLETECDVILYRGPPYHQEQFAYGIKVHVGPVAGWQPPRA
ncbi:hypothetical protein [Rhodanobacter sp. L36]|uniref:hypothetical protein n=1 Tax=Rhodanobacter sp. L36 TaxID=1747221 RepID=UPI00131AFC51|nr:hypothetical protein [Rhodanobacter sp. L36]